MFVIQFSNKYLVPDQPKMFEYCQCSACETRQRMMRKNLQQWLQQNLQM